MGDMADFQEWAHGGAIDLDTPLMDAIRRKKEDALNSPFSNPKETTPRPRIFLWGAPGAGKTTAALTFGKVAMIDLERGSQYYAGKFNFDRLDATNADEVMAAVKWIATNKHDYNTIVIDPITVYWDMVQDKWLAIKRKRKGPDSQLEFQDWKPIKAEYNALLDLLNKLDMNVVITARSSARYVDGEIASVDKADPEKPDAEKATPYLMDIELQLRMVKAAKDQPPKRIAYVRKDRTGRLPTEPFEFSFEKMRDCFGAIVDKASQPIRLEEQEQEKPKPQARDAHGNTPVPQYTAEEELGAEPTLCADCGEPVPANLVDKAVKHFGEPVCIPCGKKRQAAAKAEPAGPSEEEERELLIGEAQKLRVLNSIGGPHWVNMLKKHCGGMEKLEDLSLAAALCLVEHLREMDAERIAKQEAA